MEIQNVPDYEERPVIDIEVVGPTGFSMGWTINDTNDAEFFDDSYGHIQFKIVETGERIQIERKNALYTNVRRRIDKIPVRNSPDMDLHNVKK